MREINRDPELLRFYERITRKPPGSCVGVYELVPIFADLTSDKPEPPSKLD